MIEKQERFSGGPGVCSPETILKIYMLYNGYFSAFSIISRKLCLNFLTLILSASPNTMHFVRTRLCVLTASGLSLSKRFEIMENLEFVYIKSIFENGW